MRKIINEFQVPAALVRAAQNDPYDRGDADYSVTDLVKPVQALLLERRHEDEIEEDVMDAIWKLQGQGFHEVMRRAAPPCTCALRYWESHGRDEHQPGCPREKSLYEKRLFENFELIVGMIRTTGGTGPDANPPMLADIKRTVRVSGQLDVYDRAGNVYFHLETSPDGAEVLLQDYKLTSAWTVVYSQGQGRSDWEFQLNFLRLLAEKNGHRVDGLEVVLVCRDWNAGEFKRYASRGYPQKPVLVIRVPKWDDDLTEHYIRARLALLLSASDKPDDALPPCTPAETWHRDGKPPARCTGGTGGRPYCPVWKWCAQERARKGGG